ncbi:MAG: hypothetical protein UV73_C0023G0005 [Candidatus Gottesmanbacteria bacterium GW2011_GWA2_43_14]|uniref:Uncharacterized protein n=1 Tax=Candidatus Gottesmanbacteria bacterium GW2011_GWA2_43_14 TaxID=1618443 RepID=A0A0G1G800_9BACT|nr:MAG: hypothetical protein UV73_C0023G0005 [Candidatus Gottesmanbacteria bacterium GW2011_GWA2_43_14]
MISDKNDLQQSGIGGGPDDEKSISEETIKGLEGQQVAIESIPVSEKATDNIFWIGSDSNRILVILDKNPDNNLISEGASAVENGDTIQLTGNLKILPPVKELEENWDVPKNVIYQISNETVYLEVRNIGLNGNSQEL